MKTNTSTRNVALSRAIQMLDALGAEYKIVVDGAHYGALKLAKEKKPPRKVKTFKYPYGSVRKYIKGVVDDMKVGEVRDVPVAEFDFNALQNSVTSYAVTNWGAGSAITSRVAERHALEIMRIA